MTSNSIAPLIAQPSWFTLWMRLPKPPDPLIAHIGKWYDRLLGSLDDSDLRDQVFAAYGEWLEAPKRTIPVEVWDSLQSCGYQFEHPITQFAPAPPSGRYSLSP